MDLTGRLRHLELELQSEDADTRRQALLALAQLGPDPRVRDRLQKVSTEDAHPEIIFLARRFLENFQQEMVADVRQRVRIRDEQGFNRTNLYEFLNSEEVEIRLEAVRQLEKDPDAGSLDLVLAGLRREEDPRVRASLLRVLGAVGNSSHIAVLQTSLRHRETEVVEAAATSLNRLGGELAYPILRPLLAHEHMEVRLAVIRTLLPGDPEGVIEELRRMIASADETDRQTVVEALPFLPRETAEDLGLEILKNEAQPGLLRRTAGFLQTNGTRRSLEAATALATSRSATTSTIARELQQGLARRLGVQIEEVVAMEGAIQRSRTRKTRSLRVAAPPPPPPALSLKDPRLGITLGLLVLLVMGLCIGRGLRGGEPAHFALPPPESVAHPLLARLSDGHDLRPDESRELEFDGRVGRIHGQGRSYVVQNGHRWVHVRMDPDGTKTRFLTAGTVKLGSWIRVQGRVRGTTRLGGIYVDAEGIEP